MKKIVTLLLVCCMAFAMVGCGSGKKQSATFKTEQNGSKIKMVVDAKGDTITKITQTATMAAEGIDDAQKAVVQAEMDKMSETYSKYKSVKYKPEITDKEIIQTITIDATDSKTLKKLSSSGLFPIEGNSSKLSFKATKKGLEKAGWKVEK